MGAPDLKKMFKVKIKPRQDSYYDQFSRILMVKMYMITAAFTGLSWLKDKVTCIIPKNHDTTSGFVSKACWINGMYVYRGLPQSHSSFYYGIPADISSDGLNKYGSLCSTLDKSKNPDSTCEELEKTFFLQYQWFPLGVVLLSFFYYMPYLLFRFANKDLEMLKNVIKNKKVEEVDYQGLKDRLFTKNPDTRGQQNWRIIMNVVVKLMYVAVNIMGMLVINSALNGEFVTYGSSWIKWLGYPDNKMHDFTQKSTMKPGNYLLPSFGLCQVRSEAQDIKQTYTNVQTYVCELSQHILYQYILIILWFFLIIGILVSIVGLLKHVVNQVWHQCFPKLEGDDFAHFYSTLSTRERELMDYLRLKNMPIAVELMKHMTGKDDVTPSNSYDPYADEKKAKEAMYS